MMYFVRLLPPDVMDIGTIRELGRLKPGTYRTVRRAQKLQEILAAMKPRH